MCEVPCMLFIASFNAPQIASAVTGFCTLALINNKGGRLVGLIRCTLGCSGESVDGVGFS